MVEIVLKMMQKKIVRKIENMTNYSNYEIIVISSKEIQNNKVQKVIKPSNNIFEDYNDAVNTSKWKILYNSRRKFEENR